MNKFILSISLLISGSGILMAQSMKDGLRAIDFEKYEQAREIFQKLVQKEPTNGENYYFLGQAYLNLINPDSAEITYNAGIKIAPATPGNYAGLGELRLIEGKKADAKVHFDKALSFSKTRSGIYTDIHAIHIVATSMVNTATDKMLEEAEALVLMAYEQNKKDYDLLVAAGDVYLEKNDGGNAATFYERAIAIDPTNPKAFSRVAAIWLRVKNYEAGQTDLNRAFEKDPNYAPAWKYQAELYYAKRNFAKAKDAYATYLRNSEPSSANQIRFARILFLSKDYESALEKIDEIQKTDKKNIQLYRLKAFSTFEVIGTKNDLEKAKSGLEALNYYFEHADPKNIVTLDYLYLGRLESKVPGKDSLALIHMNKALEMDPDNYEVYTDIAKVFNKQKKFVESGDMYRKYIGVASKVTAADYYLMGKAYYFGKVYGSADSALAKVSEMMPNYPDAYFWRGLTISATDPDSKLETPKPLFEKYISLITADSVKFEANKDKYKRDLISAYGYLAYYYLARDNKALAKENYKKVLELDPENVNAKKVLSEK
jgi:tetratricopeptide (TPR) repeat protein